jgi:hypothetical protein
VTGLEVLRGKATHEPTRPCLKPFGRQIGRHARVSWAAGTRLVKTAATLLVEEIERFDDRAGPGRASVARNEALRAFWRRMQQPDAGFRRRVESKRSHGARLMPKP